MPYDRDEKKRRIPDFEEGSVSDKKQLNADVLQADSSSEHISESAADFIFTRKNQSDATHKRQKKSVSYDTDGMGFGPLLGLEDLGPVGEEQVLRPDFETEDAQVAIVPVDQYIRKEAPQEAPPARMRPREKNSKRTKIITIIVASVLGAVVVVALLWNMLFRDMWIANTSEQINVLSVGLISGLESGTTPKYAGLVQPEKTIDIKKDATKTIKEMHVDIGDPTRVGTPLFSYDTSSMDMDLRQAHFDLEQQNDKINTLNAQLKELQGLRDKAKEADKPYYVVQINAKESEIKVEEYTLNDKKQKILDLEESIKNAQVISEHDGVVTEINLSDQIDPNGAEKPFIRIQTSSDLKVTGIISELNIGRIRTGQQVVVQSRLDKDLSWTGIIDKVDYENPISSQNNTGFYDSTIENNNQASKYYFYITLDFYDGLHLGQHVYIEPVVETAAVQEGLWIPAFYVVRGETQDYVWARDESGLLVDKPVILGAYDSDSDLFQIITGVTVADFIAFPTEECIRGVPTTITQDNPLTGGDQGNLPIEGGGGMNGDDGLGGEDVLGGESGVYDENVNPYGDGTGGVDGEGGMLNSENGDGNESGEGTQDEGDRQYYDAEGNLVALSDTRYDASLEVL